MTNTLENLDHLRERTRRASPGDISADGARWVLYWMRTAMRGHDNPALDAAVELANRHELPVVVYQELRDDAEYASDRHHAFILQGARDVGRELAERGITYALHLDEGGDGPTEPLSALAEAAAAVVCEDLPVPWHRGATLELAEQASAPVLTVDTACIVPMKIVPGRHERAYKFRDAHKPLFKDRVGREWSSVEPEADPFDPSELPFEPLDPARMDIAELVAGRDIDHGVGPVGDTPGGCSAAYPRWREFRDERLADYHSVRNNAARPKGVSRMSAYLHYGQISPFRVARQAASLEGDGPEKYIDEMVTWRELAHHVSFHRDQPPGFEWLPEWARETLREHEDDERPAIYDWETLARGATDDELWNLCQRSLRAHGELHNNLRMTWAKQLLNWTETAERAIELAIDLNDRYALDGQDPNSYLGILWCFGGFDRPFDEEPIFGKVRPRSTDYHAQRLDMDKYAEWIDRAPSDPPPRVAVVGAGIAGLVCARTLHDHNVPVDVFDKGRGAGGRISTRRTDEGLRFDHGAQYFTARGDELRRHVEAWEEQGVVARWSPRVWVIDADGAREKDSDTARFVGVPGMNAVTKHLAEDLDVAYSARVSELRRDEDARTWTLEFEDGRTEGPFDVVVMTPPAPQTAALLEPVAPELAQRAAGVDFEPTWALMLGFDEELDVDFDAAFVNDGPLSWIARNASKPGRDDAETWVVHAGADWSREHVELSFDEARDALLDHFADALGRAGLEDLPEPTHARAHRWRYAKADPALEEGCLLDAERGLLVAGDWLAGSRIEGAFDSGLAAAGRVVHLSLADSEL